MKKVLIILAVIFGVFLITAFSIAGWVRNSYNGIVIMDEGINGA